MFVINYGSYNALGFNFALVLNKYGTALRQRRTRKLTIERPSKFDIRCTLRYSRVSSIVDSRTYVYTCSRHACTSVILIATYMRAKST